MRRMLRALLRIPTADLKAWKKTVAKIEKLCKTTLEGDKTALRIQNTTLSQGLSPSPGIATKMMADVLRLIRKCGVRVAIKVDDIICTATGLQEAMRAGYIISLLLTKLGAIFSPKNSLYPCVQVDWCGARICSVAGVTMQLPEKVTKMVSRAAQLRERLLNDGATIWARALMEVKGVLMAALDQVDAVRILCVEMHLLQRWLENLSEGDLDMRHQVANVPIDMRMRVIEECNTWCKDYNADNPVFIHWNGKIHVLEAPKAVIWSDACNFQMGWRVEQDKKRGHEQISVQAPFDEQLMEKHITLQETVASDAATLDTMIKRDLHHCVVSSMVDATSARKYANSHGGRKAEHTRAIVNSQAEARRRHVKVIADHVPGKINPADDESRVQVGVSEWKLGSQAYTKLKVEWGPFTVDLFAAEWNAQELRYFTHMQHDLKAAGVDALSQQLQEEKGVLYAFPPTVKKLVMALMARVESERLEMVLVLPATQTPELAMAVRLCCDEPILMAREEGLLNPPAAYPRHQEESFPLSRLVKWKVLVALRLSGEFKHCEDFRQRWQQRAISSTRSDQMAVPGAAILIERSVYSGHTSPRSLDAVAVWLSQMLFSEI